MVASPLASEMMPLESMMSRGSGMAMPWSTDDELFGDDDAAHTFLVTLGGTVAGIVPAAVSMCVEDGAITRAAALRTLMERLGHDSSSALPPLLDERGVPIVTNETLLDLVTDVSHGEYKGSSLPSWTVFTAAVELVDAESCARRGVKRNHQWLAEHKAHAGVVWMRHVIWDLDQLYPAPEGGPVVELGLPPLDLEWSECYPAPEDGPVVEPEAEAPFRGVQLRLRGEPSPKHPQSCRCCSPEM